MPTYLVTLASLNLRSTPKLADNIIGTLARGARVDGIETSRDQHWHKVSSRNKLGWASAKYLALEGDVPGPIVAVEEFPWMSIALTELGTQEVPGEGNNPRVLEYLRSTTLDRGSAAKDATPWCSAFVNWCVERAGFAGSDSAAAKSWLHWGKTLVRPRRGCIAVFKRTGGHHVGFYMGANGANYDVLGGNQGNAVCVAPYAKSRLLGFRAPG